MSGEEPLTPKQSAFALAYFETGNAAESYRSAYDVSENARDSWIYVEASQLLDNPKIALRVKELQSQAADLSLYTVKSAFDELEEARSDAKKQKNPSAAVSAIKAKMALFGMEQPKKAKVDHTSSDGTMTPQVQTYRLPENGRD